MCQQNGEFVLHGVVSRGPLDPCASKDEPGVYANIFHNIEFVKVSLDFLLDLIDFVSLHCNIPRGSFLQDL